MQPSQPTARRTEADVMRSQPWLLAPRLCHAAAGRALPLHTAWSQRCDRWTVPRRKRARLRAGSPSGLARYGHKVAGTWNILVRFSGTVSDVVFRAEWASKVSRRTLAFDEIDFEVHAGAVNILVGENGAGKSTLMTRTASAGRLASAHAGFATAACCTLLRTEIDGAMRDRGIACRGTNNATGRRCQRPWMQFRCRVCSG